MRGLTRRVNPKAFEDAVKDMPMSTNIEDRRLPLTKDQKDLDNLIQRLNNNAR